MQRLSNSIRAFFASSNSLRSVAKCSEELCHPETLINHECRRFGRRYRKWHHWPNDFLPFKWERPVHDPPYLNTGDSIRDIGVWDPKALIVGAENSQELQNAPESVRKQFSLEFAERHQIVDFQLRKITSQICRHYFDRNSPEVRIANYTVKIRNNMRHFLKVDKDDAPRKIRQNTLILKRNVLLKDLYYQDRERFENILRTLGISYAPPKLGEEPQKPTRKGELRRLTREYCEKIKEERLQQYHGELKAKQSVLADEMAKVDDMIQKESKYLGIQRSSD